MPVRRYLRLHTANQETLAASIAIGAYCARTRAYAARRTAEGPSKNEIIRCLKRYIAREVYYTLRADLAALHT